MLGLTKVSPRNLIHVNIIVRQNLGVDNRYFMLPCVRGVKFWRIVTDKATGKEYFGESDDRFAIVLLHS